MSHTRAFHLSSLPCQLWGKSAATSSCQRILVTDLFSASFKVTYRLTRVQKDGKRSQENCAEVGWSSVPVAKPMCLAAWVPIRKHTMDVGRGWEAISFFTAQLPWCTSLSPCSSLFCFPFTPQLSSCSTLHKHFPRLHCWLNEHASLQRAKPYSTKLQSALVFKSKRDACNWPNHSHTEKQEGWDQRHENI